MGLLTIGAFAKASRLSPKALRLYDELGLLTPARVDPATGYRLYDPEQLEQARLVAWLRRLGVPLARIRQICTLDPPEAAREVRAFWARFEADIAARRDLAAFLIDHLSRKDAEMTLTANPLEIHYAALTDTGLVRDTNQDTAYAGSRLLAVADGFGRGGEQASAAAIDAVKRLETNGITTGNLLNALEDAVRQAQQAVHGVAGVDPVPEEVGTTLTAMLWTGTQLALVHIGDTRAYLLRDGKLLQITHDHTAVQTMLDEGRLTKEEAASHPQRALLAKALTGATEVTPDVRLHDARPGDRYLLCSDGLSEVVPVETLREVLAADFAPEQAARELVDQANRRGGPDNVSCVVAHVDEAR
ncbi:MerR family transcriptional regulator [Streptomyces sp. RPT161]|uniref:MerR family transcriptional regulator n=1 Tax=Streptomyces sp. RPT161 TaxID=3015993 RepID=UPI0022B888F9|nr:MerR family transcriptional regulator [Streptomyces sp. RPT161]